ncbi:MAG: prolyl aminopeptidase [Bauldia litoralis]
MTRVDLYPSIDTFESGYLDLDGGHRMYWEQCGNPAGLPVVFVHGGPGAGSAPTHRRYFDPARYRIVLFDQRGAGRSTPLGGIEANTTPHLIADMELLRQRLGIDRWFLFGGSWGSTLALAYGEAHPERSLGFILRGIFLCDPEEIAWFLHGMRRIFPEAHRTFMEFLPEAERGDVLESYYARLVDPDPAVHLPAARAWSAYEGACSTLLPSAEMVSAFQQDRMALGLARIEAHYFRHGMFADSRRLLADVQRVRHLPCTIVQGRYDIVCPIMTADALARAWPEADYVVVPDAGHSAMEPGIRKALLAATDRYKTLVTA